MIFNNLHRVKFDANREIGEASVGDHIAGVHIQY